MYVQVCHFSKGNKSEIAKILWQHLKIFFSKTARPVSTKLSTKFPLVIRIWTCSFPNGNDSESSSKEPCTGPISIKRGTTHPWVKGIQVCSNVTPFIFPRGDNSENTSNPFHLEPQVNLTWMYFGCFKKFVRRKNTNKFRFVKKSRLTHSIKKCNLMYKSMYYHKTYNVSHQSFSMIRLIQKHSNILVNTLSSLCPRYSNLAQLNTDTNLVSRVCSRSHCLA